MIDFPADEEFQTIIVDGTSMERAGLRDGMEVTLQLTRDIRHRDIVVAEFADGSRTIKRLRLSRADEEVRAWLVAECNDPSQGAVRIQEGDHIIGRVQWERDRDRLTRPPYVFKGKEIWPAPPPPRPSPPSPPRIEVERPAPERRRRPAPPTVIYLPAPEAERGREWADPPAPPPRLRVLTKFPRSVPSPDRCELVYAGVVGEHDPIDTLSERRMLASRRIAQGSSFCVVQGADNLSGLGIEVGDLLYVRAAFVRTRGSYCTIWRPGDVVIASQDGMAFAGELQRYAGQLRVFSRTGVLPHLEASVPVDPKDILGVVLHAEGVAPDPVLAPV